MLSDNLMGFKEYCLLNEASLRKVKKVLHGTMSSSDRKYMKKLLRNHIVYFSFRKKDGTLRKAVGTLISSYLPALRGGSPKPEHQMVYYDLEKEHWRSFRSYSFIKILNIKNEDDYIGGKKGIHKIKDIEKHKDVDKKTSDDKKKDVKDKIYKVGEKIPEKELMRRSSDFRHGSRKNDFTKKSNDAYKKGELSKRDKEYED